MTLFIMLLFFGLLCWLATGTTCINTRFITPPRPLAHRVHQRKTRRGWIGFGSLDATLVAANDAPDNETALVDEEKDAMLREMLDLDHNASDQDVRSAFSALDEEDEKGTAENAKALESYNKSCEALGLAANAKPEDFHKAILAIPGKLKDLTDAAANEKKGRAKLLIDVAINDGRLLQSQRSVYETAFNTDFDGTAAKLDQEGQKLNTTALQLAHRKELAANSRELEQQVELAVNELQGEPKKLTYMQAWNVVKADPKFKAFFTNPQDQLSAE